MQVRILLGLSAAVLLAGAAAPVNSVLLGKPWRSRIPNQEASVSY